MYSYAIYVYIVPCTMYNTYIYICIYNIYIYIYIYIYSENPPFIKEDAQVFEILPKRMLSDFSHKKGGVGKISAKIGGGVPYRLFSY